jgi:hypothetical protein
MQSSSITDAFFSDEKQLIWLPVRRSMVSRLVCFEPVNVRLGECGNVKGDISMLPLAPDPDAGVRSAHS